MEKDSFIKMILNDEYISWLDSFMKDKNEVDCLYCVHESIKTKDIEMIEYLKYLFTELIVYKIKHSYYDSNDSWCFLKHNNIIYVIKYNGEDYSYERYDRPLYINSEKTAFSPIKLFDNFREIKPIEYKEFKASFEFDDLLRANGTYNSKLDDLIKRVVENPAEFYSKICNELTTEERKLIIEHLKNKDCTSCTNGTCRIESYEKYGLDEDGYPQGYNCIGWENPELVGKSKVLKKLDIYELK